MEWIDREVEFPECDQILVTDGQEVSIYEWIDNELGYRGQFPTYVESDWTHWMPLPELPKEVGTQSLPVLSSDRCYACDCPLCSFSTEAYMSSEDGTYLLPLCEKCTKEHGK
jgi:hypothetical protein